MSLLARVAAADAAHQARYAVVAEVRSLPGAQAVFVGPDLPMNGAHIGVGVDLEGVEALFAARGVPVRLHVFSHEAPGLLATLSGRGYRLQAVLHAFTRSLDDLPDITLPVRPLTPERFADVGTRAFGPGIERIMNLTSRRADTQFFACTSQNEPVAVAALSLLDGVAWLFSAATIPEHRGVGAQAALLAARLHVARNAGAELAAVLATPGSGSERNIARAGFQLVGARLTFERS